MSTGEVSGSVVDATGGVLADASVSARQLASGREFVALSNTSGEYLFAQLPVGAYSITVRAINFKQAVAPSVDVHAGDRLRRNFTLEVGDASGVVTVSLEAEGVQVESGEVRDVIGRRRVTDLPLKGRQFLDLAMLSPGVVRPPGGTRGDAMQQAGNLVNILGQRSGHNLYMMDGAAITDEHFNNMVIAPSMDAIEEVSVEKTSYAPEFGGKSGAVINVVSRSGSNQLHGNAFEYVRNDRFDARNFFDSGTSRIPPFRQNQFGGTVGGPLRRNKTFFFLSYEAQRVRKSLTQTFSVPTAAMRVGDFAGLPTIYDPTANAAGLRLPLAGNQVPASRLDLTGTVLLGQVPLPSLPGVAQNLRAVGTQQINGNQYSGRFDHQFSRSDTTYVRASLFDARQADPFGSGVLQESLLPGFGRNLSTHSLNGVAGWTHSFSPHLINEVRFAFLTVAGGQTSPHAGNPFAAVAGLNGVTTNPLDAGYPQVAFGGQFTTIGDPALFTYRRNRDFEFYDNAIRHQGRHTLKFGGYAMHYLLRPVNPNGARGVFSFTPRWTSSAPGGGDGNAFADFLLGFPTTAQVGLGRAAMNATTNWGHFYVQDSWQVTSRLKIDLGMRYEYNQNMTESNNQMAVVDTIYPGGRFVVPSDASGAISGAASLLLPFAPLPVVSSAAAGWNRSLLVPKSLRLAPRAGIAWSLPGSRTAIRAGVGIYPNQAAYSILTNLTQNLPFFVSKTVNSAVALTPAFTTRNALLANSVGTVGGSTLDHEFEIEYNEVWNVSVEHEVSPGMRLSGTYVGSRTVHADSGTVLNVPLPGPGAIAGRRPIPQLAQISDIRWNGWASYHAMTVAVRRRLNRGLMFDANWTWSHSIDDASDPGGTLNEANLPQNVYNMSEEKATSSFDHRHRLVASFIWQVPYAGTASGWRSMMFGNWQASGNFSTQSGAPFTVNIASDQANIGAGPAQRPNMTGDPNRGPRTAQQWFDTSVFSLPGLYSFGSAPRNSVNGPPLSGFDLAMQKEVPLTETVKLRLRAEAYNLLNHPNFNIPSRTAFTANFGRISSAQDSRQMQLALKVEF